MWLVTMRVPHISYYASAICGITRHCALIVVPDAKFRPPEMGTKQVPDRCDSTAVFVTWLDASHTQRDCGSKEDRGMGSHLRTRTADSHDCEKLYPKTV